LPEDDRQPGAVRPSFLTGLTGLTGVIVTEYRPNGDVIPVSYNVLEERGTLQEVLSKVT